MSYDRRPPPSERGHDPTEGHDEEVDRWRQPTNPQTRGGATSRRCILRGLAACTLAGAFAAVAAGRARADIGPGTGDDQTDDFTTDFTDDFTDNDFTDDDFTDDTTDDGFDSF